METSQNPFLGAALPLMQVQKSDRILQIGCGDGWVCRLLAAQAEEGIVVGLDVSDDRVRDARAKSTSFDNILYLWAPAEEIPWQENFFTTVLCVDSVSRFSNLEK